MAADEVLYETDGHVATVWFNRPDKRNAATFDMAEQLAEALHAAERDASIRAVVISGKGRAFCAGDDIEAAWGDPRMPETMRQLGDVRPPMTPEVSLLLDFPKPLIAAVNGAAVGSGMDFALLCDIRLASEHAKFGQLYVKMGLMCDVTGLWLLPQLVGPSTAAELLFTGELIGAEEAQRIGLVSRVLPADELMPAATELAHRIASNPPLAIRHIKEGLRRAPGRTRAELDELGAFVGNGLARLFSTKDHQEPVMAFMQKREGNYIGE
jgi:enoyl-CoA hydratase/carnithine racemase